MLSENAQTIAALVRRARELPPAQRLSFLREACGTDDSLFSQSASELERNTSDWWDDEVASDTGDTRGEAAEHRATGGRIGAYRVIRSLGEGGMGEVLLAERDDAEFRQRVAIKLVRRGLISRQVRGRLKTERQILARLNHPNIAKLLDGGTAPDGTPFIVMEYIEGRPVDNYCDDERLSLEARVRLFRSVCSAVHYAHQNLIIHRDLKPSNILVTADGTPKLLDFGIAKLLDERQAMHTLAVTHADYRMLTPDHASPEQIQGQPITTASDIYVLGILLYELLTGRRPFNVTAIRLSEIERAICDQPPPPPSALIEAMERDEHSSAANQLAHRRSTSIGKLRRSIRGDLDNIVLLALRKEPERRYSSAEQFSGDLDRFLQGLPVLAQSDTWSYRAKKFVRRHTIAVALSAALLVSVLAFAITSYVQADRIARQRDAVAAQREIADQQRNRAEQVSSFLIDLFRVSDPSQARASEVTAQEILDQGARKIDRELTDQPELRATLLETIGRVYLSLGQVHQAEAALSRSLSMRQNTAGTSDVEIASTMSGLAEVLMEKGELDEAERLQREALERYGGDGNVRHVDFARSLATLGRVLKTRGNFSEAEVLLNQSMRTYLRDTPSDPGVTAVISDLALIALDRGELGYAENLYRRAIELARGMLGEDSLQFALQLHNLALVHQAQGNLREAEIAFKESLALFDTIYGDKHIETIRAAGNYALFLRQAQRLEESEAAYRRVLRMDQEVRGERHSLVGYDMANLASVLMLRAQPIEAESLLRNALSIYAETLPPDHPHVGAALYLLGYLLVESQRQQDALPLLERSVSIMGRAVPHSVTEAAVRSALGRAYMRVGRLTEAEPLLLSSYEDLRAKAPDHTNTTRAAQWLRELFEQSGRPQEAQKYALDQRKKRPGPGD